MFCSNFVLSFSYNTSVYPDRYISICSCFGCVCHDPQEHSGVNNNQCVMGTVCIFTTFLGWYCAYHATPIYSLVGSVTGGDGDPAGATPVVAPELDFAGSFLSCVLCFVGSSLCIYVFLILFCSP